MIPTKCACVRTRRASRALSDLYDAALRPTRLKITQFSALRTIRRLQPVSISRLAQEMALDRSTLGRNLSLLKTRGLVRLTDGEDLREWSVQVTAKADALLADAVPLWDKAQAKVDRLLGKKGVASLFDLLEKLEGVS